MLYRYETHCHSAQCSRCAHSSARELVLAFHQAGYAGLVLTDHFIHGNTAVDRSLPWEEQMRRYYGAFLEAKAAAKDLDFDVIFGIEHAYGGGQEVLCFGIDLDFLLENPDIPELSLEEFADRVHKYGGILIQAHPYRYGGIEIPIPMDLIDGIEVYNAGNQPEKNVLALQKAGERDCILTSGGDIHASGESRVGAAGIALPYRVHDEKELVAALKRQDHQLIIHRRVIAKLREDLLFL